MEKIISMGFEAGFTMALGNPDELLSKKWDRVIEKVAISLLGC